ncbi:MAG: adenosylmethionine--8-amino-7-oxononanoate transaminase [Thermodesulfobacteriota bacterium]
MKKIGANLNVRRLEKIDQKVLWHPFTQMQDYAQASPLIIEEGRGTYLRDIHGKWYLDGVSSLWVNVHGHRKKEIDQAIIHQVRRVSHSTLLGISNVPAIELAEQLVRIAPRGLSKVFYSDNGSTAVEVALKMAFQFWKQSSKRDPKKRKFIALKNGYHGDTIGSVSLGGIDLFHGIYRPLLFPTLKVESPYCYRCPLDQTFPQCGIECLNLLEEMMKRHHSEVAAFVLEPIVQGAGGMIVFPKGYLKEARFLCSKYNVLMIADEVATGFGRTGKMFACEHEKVSPDLMAISKGISAGYLPLAATLTTEEIYRAFLGGVEEQKTFYHGHSYTGNPLACRAALANLELFRKERVLEALQPKIRFLKGELQGLCSFQSVGDIRQKGMMVGIELVKDREKKTPFPLKDRMGHRVIIEARKRGIIIRPLGDVIVLMPPLSITKEELRRLTQVVFDSIEAVFS